MMRHGLLIALLLSPLAPTPAAASPIPACGEEGAHALSCLALTVSSPLTAIGDAAGNLYNGERDGDAFTAIAGNADGLAFDGVCLPGDSVCRNLEADVAVYAPGGGLGVRFAAIFADELSEWRDNMCAQQQRNCAGSRHAFLYTPFGTRHYDLGEAAAVAAGDERDIFLAALYGYQRGGGEPEYATLARWVFYAVDDDKRDRSFDVDQPIDGYYQRYGYGIFAANTVASPASGRADYDVSAMISYNAPRGDYPAYRWHAEPFSGRWTADFATGEIGGRLSRWLSRHLDFDGEISGDCADGGVCFSGAVSADFRRYGFWEEGFDGQTGTFRGAFYDAADSGDGSAVPLEVGGVFGGLFNADGGELIGGFLGDAIDPLSAPGSLAAQVGGEGESAGVVLTWKAVSGAGGYKIYRDGVLIHSAPASDILTYTDDDAGVGEHSYTMAAYKGLAESPLTAPTIARVSPRTPHVARHDRVGSYLADANRQNIAAADGGARLTDVYINDDGDERAVKHLTYASYGVWNAAPTIPNRPEFEYVSFADNRPPSLPSHGTAAYALEGDADYRGYMLDMVRGQLIADFTNGDINGEMTLSHESIAYLAHPDPAFAGQGERQWGLKLRFSGGDGIDSACGCFRAEISTVQMAETIDDGTRMTLRLPDPTTPGAGLFGGGNNDEGFGIFDSVFDGGDVAGNFHDARGYDPSNGDAPAEVSGHFATGESRDGAQIKGAFLGARTSQSGIAE